MQPSTNLGVVPDDQSEAQNALAERFKDTMIDAQSKLYDKSTAYSNLIMVGGYAGAFTIWGNTTDDLTRHANILVATTIGFSLLVFILYQVYKMATHILHFNKIRYIISDNRTLAEFFREWNALEKQQANYTLRNDTWASAICLVICVGTALTGVFTLFYNFLAIMFDWPKWPA